MQARYGGALALIPLCEARWYSKQGFFASISRARTALVDLWHDCKVYKDTPVQLQPFGDEDLWHQLAEAN